MPKRNQVSGPTMISWVLPMVIGAPSAAGGAGGGGGGGGGASGGGCSGGGGGGAWAAAVTEASISAEATSEADHIGLRNLLVMFYSSLRVLLGSNGFTLLRPESSTGMHRPAKIRQRRQGTRARFAGPANSTLD